MGRSREGGKESCMIIDMVMLASLGTRPFTWGRRKGSAHHLTFELSPGWNVDLTNQKC